MNRLKHILVMIALLLVALPCTHADDHHHGAPFSESTDQISAVHTCECHSCDSDTVCTEPLEVEQNLSSATVDAVYPAATFQLFALNLSQPATRRAAPSVPGPHVRLMTVQLLI